VRVLVTGGEGFVGGHLTRLLVAEGHHVTATALDLGATGQPEGAGGGYAVAWRELDVLDRARVRETIALVSPDVIFHLAGFSSGSKARERSAQALRTNAEGTLNVCEGAAAEAPVARVIVTGSSDVYGDPGPEPVEEEAEVRPITPYGLSKAAQELVAHSIGDARGTDVLVARMFPLVGPGQDAAFVVPSFCHQAVRIAGRREAAVLRVGTLDVERDFTDVRDGARALAMLGALDAPRYRTYNICSGTGTTVRTLLGWIVELAGVDFEIVVDPARVRAHDPLRIVGSSARLCAETGWHPALEVRDAVRDTYRWVQKSMLGVG